MPELPDLENYRVNLFARLTSKRLTGIEIFNYKNVRGPRGASFDALAGLCLLGISRVGKELFFDFGDRHVLSAHLMLHGEMSLPERGDIPALKHKIAALHFERESLLFRDKDGLCAIKYKPSRGRAPDALDPAFSLDYFIKTARENPIVNVKAFLIDQKIVRGIGNAYADEILWAARVSPHCLLLKIPDDVLETLYHAIGTVLRGAIESIRRIAPGILSGEERSFLKVHGKDRIETETGYLIQMETIVSKVTYYTKEQVLY